MPARHVIFDLDGTLLDTLQDLADAVNQALSAAGLPGLSDDSYRLLVGSGARNLVRRAAQAAGLAPERINDSLTEQLLESFNQAYSRNWAEHTRPYEGIYELLDRLRLAGLQLAVLSNKPDSFTQLIVSRFFPAGCFSVVSGKRDGWPIKPDPALTLEICRQTGADPAATALVGDSGSDMTTAINAGLMPVGVLWGFRSREELTAAGARHLADDPVGLYNILTGDCK